MIDVISSNIAQVAHDPLTLELQVKFKNGGHYAYDNVPVILFDDLVAAESVGKFFNEHIKTKGFGFRRVVAHAA